MQGFPELEGEFRGNPSVKGVPSWACAPPGNQVQQQFEHVRTDFGSVFDRKLLSFGCKAIVYNEKLSIGTELG